MLTGVSPSSGDSSAASPVQPTSTAAAAELGFSEDERGKTDDGGGGGGGRSSGGNRWPRQETLYLLKIRSDMDVAFRDASLKGPLWEEVSRKLASLGFHRSAKKCKEKFENVYKYHKRIKEGRSSKADGKTYKFFEQLQALEGSPSAAGNHHQPPPPPLPLPLPPPVVSKPAQVTITSMPSVATPSELQQNNVDPISVAAPAGAVAVAMNVNVNNAGGFPFSQLNVSESNSSGSSSSSEEEDEVVPEKRRNRKRKWKEFFGRLMKEVVEKQEELQSKFLDALDRRERDRMAREEAWRMQEMAKMKREHELLVQERSMVAAKDAAVVTFLQKITEQNPNTVIPQMPAMQLLQQQQQQQQQQQPTQVEQAPAPPAQPTPPMQQQPPPQLQPQPQQRTPPALAATPVSVPVPVPVHAPLPLAVVKNPEIATGENTLQPSPSRWPKAEINALIQIRTSLDTKYQDSGPKGPLWEEVSTAMRNLGYNRNAKRCKEKWENINKYYKKVKESSKKRPEDSKTCPYFHQLDAIYREKAASGSSSNNNSNSNPGGLSIKPETQMAIMARPEQQWPHPAVVQQQQQAHQYQQKQQQQQQLQQQNADLNEDDYDDEDDDDDDEDEEGGEYEIVPNKTSSMASAE
ncbi:putative transcription factor MYB family [Helianthus annuus]|uniref:Putative duplicated homeodomain-like superfamily protein n=1 Tax=Helianthus annuus TaxID=4232 RepID=A0A251TG07_HELAN|nr:trihelix transcription factor GT-2 [Helianthus annuus]KAF5784710.1 putative transcription factor MYB family [Helianthus annuus]